MKQLLLYEHQQIVEDLINRCNHGGIACAQWWASRYTDLQIKAGTNIIGFSFNDFFLEVLAQQRHSRISITLLTAGHSKLVKESENYPKSSRIKPINI